MDIELAQRIEFLSRLPLFKDLEEEQVKQIAGRMHEYSLPAGEALFSQGSPGDKFYLIYRGRVRVFHVIKGQERDLGTLEGRDYFGQGALLFQQPRSASIASIERTQFLYLDRADFQWMTRTFPQVKHHLQMVALGHRWAEKLNFDWLGTEEIIHLVSRRHVAELALDLLRPFLILLLAAFMGVIYWIDVPGLTSLSLGLGGLFLVVAILWGIWATIDWRNDYFIITSQRVVWLEYVLLQSDSRQEAPIAAIQSVNVESNYLGRVFGFGNVFIRTFTGSGSLSLRNVDRPQRFKALVEEFILRVRVKNERAKSDAIRSSIRESLGLQAKAETQSSPPASAEVEPERSRRFNFFRTRTVEGDVITYHKHWFVLLKKITGPVLGVVLSALVVSYFVYRAYPAGSGSGFPSLLTTLVLGLPLVLAFVLLALYHFLDWQNDLYRITRDSVIDSERKPLGREVSKSAPIKNIQSLQHNRIGILGLLLNFGDVNISVADATLKFESVHNPAQVQQDIFYRQERLKLEGEQAEGARERVRMTEWMTAYHEIQEEARRKAESSE